MIQHPFTFGSALICLSLCLPVKAYSTQNAALARSSQAGASPVDVEQLYAAGETALRAGDLVRAEQNFRMVLARNPGLAGGYANLGVIAMRRYQRNQAPTLLTHVHRSTLTVAGG